MFFAKVIKPTYYICAIPKLNEFGAENPYKYFICSVMRSHNVELQRYPYGSRR